MELYELIDRFILKSSRVIRKEKEELIGNDDLNGITYGQFNILYWISTMENPTVTALAEKMGMTKPTMTVHVQNLVKLGLLAKEKSKDDKRVSYIRLTERARNVKQAEMNAFKSIAGMIEAKLTPDEVENFKRLLEKIEMY